ncbi:MAG: VWA domain-containing protein [Spirochaetaceae bacterium]|nr:VWA domain-containing protein [Spirochaetaceae bacterium]
MWSFEQPLLLGALLLLPPAVYLVYFRPGRGGVLRVPLHRWGATPLVRRGADQLLAVAARAPFWLAAALLIVAAAGPARVHRDDVHLSPGLDLMIVLDESPSMAARDLGGARRLDAAVRVIRDFVAGRGNDAIGLVSFSDRAVLRVAKTLDRAALHAALDRMAVPTLGDTTAIGMGIAVALLHLQDSAAPGRVIVLLTDGDNNAGELTPEAAAALAAARGVRIYTVGIGGAGDAVIEITDPRTGLTQRGRYRGRFDPALLERVAQITGGRSFAADEPGVLAAVFREIDALERVDRHTRGQVSRRPHHRALLLAALCVLLLDVALRRVVLAELF